MKPGVLLRRLPSGFWTEKARVALFAVFGAALLLYPRAVQNSVAASLEYCLATLVPSLFPFMVLASFGVRSGAGRALGRLLSPLTRWGFRLPASCGATVLLSFLGGYPAGARGVSLLLEQEEITPRQAGRMMLFCVNPGAAFVVTFVGCGVLGSPRKGWLLFGAVTAAGLLLGVLSALGKPLPPKDLSAAINSPSGALVRSVGDASSATVTMCACIVLFAGFTAILQGSGLYRLLEELILASGCFTQEEASTCLAFLLEVTGGTGEAARYGVAPVFYAFGLAFGGLCVHLQVGSFFRGFPVSKGKFLLFRVLHSLFACLLYLCLDRILPGPSQPVWAAAGVPLSGGGLAAGIPGGLSLLLLCVAFLVGERPSGHRCFPRGS